ncbi:MAG: FliH/SctL family protein [Planctomycetota bacterium]|jgi:flagellar biosynthesis/type III secretory pathway protein FliH
MTQIVTIQVKEPIFSAKLFDGPAMKPVDSLEAEKATLGSVCRALQETVDQVNRSQEELFEKYKEQIVKLSVEIAGRILAQRTEKGDYEIESIVQEALGSAPCRQDLVVRLNPDDLAGLQKAQQGRADSDSGEVRFVADPGVGKAECVVETPKGIIQSLISERLEQITEMLMKAV